MCYACVRSNTPANSIFKTERTNSLQETNQDYAALARELLSLQYAEQPLAFVHTFGCQGNVADGERLKGMLAEMGYAFTEEREKADLILYNTCAIREHAQDRVFGNVGAVKKLKERKRSLRILLCGCMMQQEQVAEKIRQSYSFVDIVFGTHVIHRMPELLYRNLSEGRRMFLLPQSEGEIHEELPLLRDSSYKAWLPVMYGCNNFCSYCIVPYVRGRERSRELDAVLAEAQELIAQGYKEITLLGQNVNSYGKTLSGGVNFSRLLRELDAMEGDFWIRFMTSHPKDCSRELLDTMAACNKVAGHLHLPVQSGSNRILGEMNRGYTRETYLELLAYAREVMPELCVTSDIIVGFPGETEEEFAETLTLVEQAQFSSLFTFIYSAREGTRAFAMPDPVPHQEKAQRMQALLDLQESIAAKRSAALMGREMRVLCEEKASRKAGNLSGRSAGNLVITFPADESLIGSFQTVKITEHQNWMLNGELL